jgi:Txe/YoeB family toxin of Txe-Axe toxin-antitoxin module
VRLVFTATAWEQYLSHTDGKLVKRINDLIADVMRNGYEGIGKPEPLARRVVRLMVQAYRSRAPARVSDQGR